jgi:hypothetical protein
MVFYTAERLVEARPPHQVRTLRCRRRHRAEGQCLAHRDPATPTRHSAYAAPTTSHFPGLLGTRHRGVRQTQRAGSAWRGPRRGVLALASGLTCGQTSPSGCVHRGRDRSGRAKQTQAGSVSHSAAHSCGMLRARGTGIGGFRVPVSGGHATNRKTGNRTGPGIVLFRQHAHGWAHSVCTQTRFWHPGPLESEAIVATCRTRRRRRA